MRWALVSDSSCNLRGYTPTAPDTIYRFAPLKIRVGEHEYIDDETLDTHQLNMAVAAETSASSSSCPSVGEWAELFTLAENTICMPISDGLSGSYEAASTAREMVLEKDPGRKIHLINSRAAGGKMDLLMTLFDRYLTNNPSASFEEVCEYCDDLEAHSQILFMLSNYENLSKAGRMPKMAGLIANKLNIRILGTASPEGTIKIVGPTRGEKKMYTKIVDTMASDGFEGGEVFIDHVENLAGAQALGVKIDERWPGSKITIMPCGGLDSYYAEMNGLIIGYGWDAASGR